MFDQFKGPQPYSMSPSPPRFLRLDGPENWIGSGSRFLLKIVSFART